MPMNRRDFVLGLARSAACAAVGAVALFRKQPSQRITASLHMRNGSRVDFVGYGDYEVGPLLDLDGPLAQWKCRNCSTVRTYTPYGGHSCPRCGCGMHCITKRPDPWPPHYGGKPYVILRPLDEVSSEPT